MDVPCPRQKREKDDRVVEVGADDVFDERNGAACGLRVIDLFAASRVTSFSFLLCHGFFRSSASSAERRNGKFGAASSFVEVFSRIRPHPSTALCHSRRMSFDRSERNSFRDDLEGGRNYCVCGC